MKNHNMFKPDIHHLLNRRILVKIPKLGDQTYGGIYLTPEGRDKEQQKVIKGELISYAENAFYDKIIRPDGSSDFVEWKVKPEIGDIVFFTIYAGNIYIADDDCLYRNMTASDLTGFEPKEE